MQVETRDDTIEVTAATNADAETAFRHFVEHFNDWWPQAYTFAGEDLVEIGVEPLVGGRCYERDRAGTELVWGEVLACDPPTSMTFTWMISPAREIEPDPGNASEIDVEFSQAGPNATVRLRHRGIAHHSGDWETMHALMAGQFGWPAILAEYVSSLEDR